MDLPLDAALRDMNSPRSATRRLAAEALGEHGQRTERALDALTSALCDGSSEVRYAAALSLGNLGATARPAVAALIERLERDDASLVRQASAVALGQIGAEEAADALIGALQRDCADVRFQIPCALSSVASAERAGEALLLALTDSDAEVRAAVAATMGDIAYGAAVAPLQNALQDPNEDVVFEATLALARIGEPGGTLGLCRFLRHPEHRLTAARQLFSAPLPQLRPTLLQELQRWLAPPLLRVWLAGALARLGDPSGEQRLRKLARRGPAPARGLAREVLAQLGASG